MRPCGSVAETFSPFVAPVATVMSETGAITGGSSSGSTVSGIVIVLVRNWPLPMAGLRSVARKLTEVVPMSANVGVHLKISVSGSNVAPGGKVPTGVTLTVAGSSLSCTRLPLASRCGGT